MNRLTDLLRPDGKTGRLGYLLAGTVLLVLKHALDLGVADHFGRAWSPFAYFVLPTEALGVLRLPREQRWFLGTLLAVAVPFISVGVLMTLRRLNDAGLPGGLTVLFFLPLVNLLFFLLLAVLPGRPAATSPEEGPPPEPLTTGGPPGDPATYRRLASGYSARRWRRLRDVHHRLTRDSVPAEAGVALLLTVPAAIAFVGLSTVALENYGWGLFVGGPFVFGLATAALFGLSRPQPLRACLAVVMLGTTIAGFAILLLALEGAICLIMAAPLGYALTALGGLVGYALQSRPWLARDSFGYVLLLGLTLPALLAAESRTAPEPEEIECVSAVEIDAPPEVVWRAVVAFPELPPPDDWLFRCGVAYPVRAEIDGTGPGAVRCCVFSTGAFVEPIDVWDEPRLLAFRVTEQPEPMTEWSPYRIHPPHLDNYLVSRRGQFRLVALPDGRTRLEGTTWYTNRMWPAAYWRLWSDHIIHKIHLRVLRHIKAVAEDQARWSIPEPRPARPPVQ
jgi:hypothetical protein